MRSLRLAPLLVVAGLSGGCGGCTESGSSAPSAPVHPDASAVAVPLVEGGDAPFMPFNVMLRPGVQLVAVEAGAPP
jgi:hypothetical protein